MKISNVLALSLLCCSLAHAATVEVTMGTTATDTQSLGTVTFSDTPFGLLITPQLAKLPEGVHGFHLHQHADCGDHGQDAGAHYDPQQTNSHLGPYALGHLGDLPVLAVNAQGTAQIPTLAPRLKTTDLKGLALMIHAGGDNYSDTPPLGGGGDRIGCGVISQSAH